MRDTNEILYSSAASTGRESGRNEFANASSGTSTIDNKKKTRKKNVSFVLLCAGRGRRRSRSFHRRPKGRWDDEARYLLLLEAISWFNGTGREEKPRARMINIFLHVGTLIKTDCNKRIIVIIAGRLISMILPCRSYLARSCLDMLIADGKSPRRKSKNREIFLPTSGELWLLDY